MTATIEIIGETKCGSQCDCCGKENIRTIHLRDRESRDTMKIGTTCLRQAFFCGGMKITETYLKWVLSQGSPRPVVYRSSFLAGQAN